MPERTMPRSPVLFLLLLLLQPQPAPGLGLRGAGGHNPECDLQLFEKVETILSSQVIK